MTINANNGSVTSQAGGSLQFAGGLNITNAFISAGGGNVIIWGGVNVLAGTTTRRGFSIGGRNTVSIYGGNTTADRLVVGNGNSGNYTQTNGLVTIGVSAPAVVELGAGGSSTYTAIVNLNGGTLNALGIAADGGWLGTGTINLNGGIFQAGGNSKSLFSTDITGSPAGSILVQAGGAVIDTASFIVTQVQPLLAGSPSGGLVMFGGGQLDLAGANTYTGTTTASNGTLLVAGSLAAGSAVIVLTNATLGGTGTIGGAVTANAGSTLSPGSSNLGTLTVNNNLTLDNGAGVVFRLNTASAPVTNDSLVVSGTQSITGGMLTVTNVGPALQVGDRFQLLRQPTAGFTTVNLPTGYYWSNNLAVDGSIQVISVYVPQTLFISPSGSDTNSGALGTPLKTLAAAMPFLNPGDTLYLRAGTYRETLTPINSGTSIAPITIAAYSNEVVMITGCDLITNTWSFTSNGIYATPVGGDLGEGYNHVFVDGVMQHEAQYPNWTATNGLLNPPTVNVKVYANYTITNTASTGFGGLAGLDLIGAHFFGGVGQMWAWQTAVISSNSNKSVFLDASTASTWWWPNQLNVASSTGIGLVYGKLNLLDADGEWYLDSGSSILYLRIMGGADPGTHTVEMKHRVWCVNIDGYNYVTVRGLATQAGAIRLNGTGNVLDSCDAGYLSHYLTFAKGSSRDGGFSQGGGVVLSGTNNTLQGCTIHDTAGSGVNVSGTGGLITRNHIYHTDYAGTYACSISLSGTGHSVRFNTAHDSGRDILIPSGCGQDIEYNDFSHPGRLCLDEGAIYTYGQNAQSASGSPTRIAYNWVHDGDTNSGKSMGIYLDNGSRNFLVDHNVIWNFGLGGTNLGLYLNSPGEGTRLYHNTLVNCGAYNRATWDNFPANNPDPTYWTTNNNHLFYTAQNNLVLTSTAAVNAALANAAGLNFVPKAGGMAVNPAATNYVVTWCTTNGVTGVPPGFSLSEAVKNQLYCYQEVAGQGVVLPGINDGYLGATPDSGAYEFSGPCWQPGTNGWAVEQPVMQTVGVAGITETNATLLGTLISSGLPAASVQVFWGTNDGGTNVANWPNHLTLGTHYTGSSLIVTQFVGGLAAGTTYAFRFYAANPNGESWGVGQIFRTPINMISVSSNGSALTLSWPSNYLGWILQAQTNALNAGLQTATNAWFDVPGSAGMMSTNLPVTPANPTVFYRLRHP